MFGVSEKRVRQIELEALDNTTKFVDFLESPLQTELGSLAR